MKIKRLAYYIFLVCMTLMLLKFTVQPTSAQANMQEKVAISANQLENAMTEPTVEIKFVKMLWRKPPKKELLMDVTLNNHYNQPCWFLLPGKVHGEDSLNTPLGQSSFFQVETFEIVGKGRVIIGRFAGDNSPQILLLPPGAKLKIRQLPIAYWNSDIRKQKVSVEVVIADQVNIDGESAQAWFKTNPMSDVQADVNADQRKSLGLKSPPGEFMTTVPISIVEKERFTLEVPLIKKVEN
jgi:hypothetical protein